MADDTYVERLIDVMARMLSMAKEQEMRFTSFELCETVDETRFRFEIDHFTGITKSGGSV